MKECCDTPEASMLPLATAPIASPENILETKASAVSAAGSQKAKLFSCFLICRCLKRSTIATTARSGWRGLPQAPDPQQHPVGVWMEGAFSSALAVPPQGWAALQPPATAPQQGICCHLRCILRCIWATKFVKSSPFARHTRTEEASGSSQHEEPLLCSCSAAPSLKPADNVRLKPAEIRARSETAAAPSKRHPPVI